MIDKSNTGFEFHRRNITSVILQTISLFSERYTINAVPSWLCLKPTKLWQKCNFTVTTRERKTIHMLPESYQNSVCISLILSTIYLNLYPNARAMRANCPGSCALFVSSTDIAVCLNQALCCGKTLMLDASHSSRERN